MADSRSFPTRGTNEWFQEMEQRAARQAAEIDRLWTMLAQVGQQVGDLPMNPDVELP